MIIKWSCKNTGIKYSVNHDSIIMLKYYFKNNDDDGDNNNDNSCS